MNELRRVAIKPKSGKIKPRTRELERNLSTLRKQALHTRDPILSRKLSGKALGSDIRGSGKCRRVALHCRPIKTIKRRRKKRIKHRR